MAHTGDRSLWFAVSTFGDFAKPPNEEKKYGIARGEHDGESGEVHRRHPSTIARISGLSP